MTALDRIFRISPEFLRQFPGLEARANRYFPALRAIVSGVIAVITLIALLEVWGIDATDWLSGDRIGGPLLSALGRIAIPAVVPLLIWGTTTSGTHPPPGRLSR